jgi:DNA polymerase
MYEISIDFETYSEVDLEKQGVYAYAQHPSTEILCCAYAINNDKIQVYRCDSQEVPRDLLDAISAGAKIRAWNANFERLIWQYVAVKKLGWGVVNITQWIDDMAVSAYCGFPLSLEKCANMLKLDARKDKRGKELISKFCKKRTLPQDDTHGFNDLVSYCIQDVKVQQSIVAALPRRDLPEAYQKVWVSTQKLNDRGIRIDVNSVKNALPAYDTYIAALQNRLQEITQGKVKTGKQVAKILEFINDSGCDLDDLQKNTLKSFSSNDPLVSEIISIRQDTALSSISKYKKMLQCHIAGKLHGTLQFFGATRTGRFTGRLVQLQNLPRASVADNVIDALQHNRTSELNSFGKLSTTLKNALRQMLIADGVYAISDYANIEPRIIAWLADDHDTLISYVREDDQYLRMAASIFNDDLDVLINEYTKRTPEAQHKRLIGKITVLGCGYGMGAAKFLSMANTEYRLGMDENTALRCIQAYRKEKYKVPELWAQLEKAAKSATAFKGRVFKVGRVSFCHTKWHLFCKLPSGRNLCYPYARLGNVWITEDAKKLVLPIGAVPMNAKIKSKEPVIIFKEVPDDEHVVRWSSIWGGTFLENISQAIAADVLQFALLRLDDEGMRTVLHVHDEIVCDVDDTNARGHASASNMCMAENSYTLDLPQRTKSSLDTLNLLMITPCDWSKDLPLKVEGFYSKRYRK